MIGIVNAGSPLPDAEIAAIVPAMQLWDNMMLRPQWGFDPCTYNFMTWAQFEASPPAPEAWPIFVNRHSTDPGVLGWHDDQSGRVFGRVFVADCIRDGISWSVDISHEAAEMRGNPKLTEYVTLPDGRFALRELCDPVESDDLAIAVLGVKLSDFVLPSYFAGGAGPWDYGRHLTGPCPTLTPGGYQSVDVPGQPWQQIAAMEIGKGLSARAARFARSRRRPRIAP